MKKIKRTVIQAIAALLANLHLPNFSSGALHAGTTKQICSPGLNCYSCPAATGACPVGAFQAVAGSTKHNFSYYVTGTVMLFGILGGRFVCGYLCPFGWFQELLHKIPSKKFSTKKIYFLTYLKYIILIVTVILLPVLATDEIGMGLPYFCKYICPQGILEGGIPISIVSASIRTTLGSLFSFKLAILILVILLSIGIYRPFCKWICPLGAFYAVFNKFSLHQYTFDENKCIHCSRCIEACHMDVDITKTIDNLECIRCGECIRVCPTAALGTTIKLNLKTKKTEANT